MLETLDSKCCTVYKYVYIENLNASNWMYGNQTPEQYQASRQDYIDSLEADNSTMVKECPLATPFPDENNVCSVCKDTSLIFNLETKKCEECPIGKIFNYGTRTCDFNITCPAGTKFNEKTVLCEVIAPSINSSFCPPDAPIWNDQVKGCFQCESSKPFFDVKLQACTECP